MQQIKYFSQLSNATLKRIMKEVGKSKKVAKKRRMAAYNEMMMRRGILKRAA